MRHSFSSEFLKIVPPALNFGEAWENLCLHLLRIETLDDSIMRLGPPDRGIDIYRQRTRDAYQCKSNERGVFGTINADVCIESLKAAILIRSSISWTNYSIAVNAPISGIGLSKINEFATANGLSNVPILPAEYWNDLCIKHTGDIAHLFDYRIFKSEAEVIEAFRKAKYFDDFINKAEASLGNAPLKLMITNNRLPVELNLPFSSEFTIEQLLDVVQEMLGVPLDRNTFPDLGTSCAPQLSILADGKPQSLALRLAELTPGQLEKLQLWIKFVWRDERAARQSRDETFLEFSLGRLPDALSPIQDRGSETLSRMESRMQGSMWEVLVRAR